MAATSHNELEPTGAHSVQATGAHSVQATGAHSLEPVHEAVHEPASVWGWHASFGKWRDIAGVIVVIILLLMTTTTHYNEQGTMFLWISAGAIILGLLIDRSRRKNAWRK